jgi:hypothetical protein
MKQVTTLGSVAGTAVASPRVDRLDQRIIEMLVAEDGTLIEELSRGGLNEESVRAQARELGMTNEFIKQCRLSGSRPAMRRCIACDASFLSSGIDNRLCRRCPRR